MSSPAGTRREVAYRVFAAEFDDAVLEHSSGESERAPNYVITPAGARINRLFAIGVLTEVDQVGGDVLRGRVVDPTGAFVCYAGQYQPEAMTFLEEAAVPSYVAVTGKARTFQPDDGDRIFTSVRPETLNTVDAATRDRWTVQTAEHTIDRVGTCAAAIDRSERGEALRRALLDAGVSEALAEGISLAIDHYGTTKAYLAALQTIARQALEVVAGVRDEVDPLTIEPSGDGPVEVDFVTESTDWPGTMDTEAPASTTTESAESITVGTDTGEPAGDAPEVETTRSADAGEEAAGRTDEMYEFDAEERAEIEAEYGTEFSTGSEIDEPGQADIDTADEPPAAPDESPPVDAESSGESEDASTESPSLDDVVVAVIRDADDSAGAEREHVISTIVEEHDADRDTVEAAIHDAMMRGECYEPEDGLLKAI